MAAAALLSLASHRKGREALEQPRGRLFPALISPSAPSACHLVHACMGCRLPSKRNSAVHTPFARQVPHNTKFDCSVCGWR
jgi:hypothetical protein